MIDVKEANEATAQVREEVRKSWGGKAEPLFRGGGPYESESFRAFRDPAEMVTISANRFERLIRQNEDLQHRLTSCENLLNAVSSFVDQEAMRYAQKGKELPSWEDAFKVGEIIHWTEPAAIRYVRWMSSKRRRLRRKSRKRRRRTMAKRQINRTIAPGVCIYCGNMCYPGINASDHMVKHRMRPPRYFHMDCYNRFMAQEDQKEWKD